MKRLALIVVGVAALASFNVTAQAPATHARPRSPKTSRRSCSASARTATGRAKWRRCRCCRTRTRGRGRRRSRPRSWRARCRPGAPTCRRRLPMRNDISLSQKEIDTIAAWVDGGAPRGNAADMPPRRRSPPGWTYGTEPDVVLEMPVEFDIPAEGELGVQMFYSKVPWNEDRFAEIVELSPATAPSCITPASSSSTFPKARRSSTAASSTRTAR